MIEVVLSRHIQQWSMVWNM